MNSIILSCNLILRCNRINYIRCKVLLCSRRICRIHIFKLNIRQQWCNIRIKRHCNAYIFTLFTRYFCIAYLIIDCKIIYTDKSALFSRDSYSWINTCLFGIADFSFQCIYFILCIACIFRNIDFCRICINTVYKVICCLDRIKSVIRINIYLSVILVFRILYTAQCTSDYFYRNGRSRTWCWVSKAQRCNHRSCLFIYLNHIIGSRCTVLSSYRIFCSRIAVYINSILYRFTLVIWNSSADICKFWRRIIILILMIIWHINRDCMTVFRFINCTLTKLTVYFKIRYTAHTFIIIDY